MRHPWYYFHETPGIYYHDQVAYYKVFRLKRNAGDFIRRQRTV